MGPSSACQGESSRQVALQMFDLLYVLHQLRIYCLLGVLGIGFPLPLSIFALLTLFIPGLWSIFQLIFCKSSLLLEVRIINIGRNTIQSNLCGSGNHIGGVNSLERNSIHAIGASNQNIARWKILQHNNPSSPMIAREQNNNLSRLDILAPNTSLSLVSSSLIMCFFIISWIPGIFLVSEFAARSPTICCMMINIYRDVRQMAGWEHCQQAYEQH